MKYKLKKVNIIKQALGLLSVCAGVALIFGVLTYVQLNRQIETNENSSQMLMTLVQTARINILLHDLNKEKSSEKPDTAKKFLNGELAANLKSIKTMAPLTDAYRQWTANMVLEQVARDEKRHPENYLVASQRTRL